MKRITAGLLVTLLILACAGSDSSSNSTTDELDLAGIRSTGREVVAIAQSTLVSQLGRALSAQDAAYAVQFCNLEVSQLVDSINQANNCTVRRLTSRRRNPANKIETVPDKVAWNYFRASTSDLKTQDTVLTEPGAKPVYYKPIYITSETCLRCHGSRSQDIELATLEKISELYPTDAAVNYHLGDLRGMWKISFE